MVAKFGKRFILVWVVGSNIFNDFKEQDQITSQKKVVPVEEYVLVPQFK